MKLCTIDFLEAGSYVGLKSLVKTHSLFNMDLIFDIFPNKIIPFDYDTYFSSGMECILTATNALTGKAEYLSEKSDRQRLMTICRASSSLPVVSPIVDVDGIPMVDGGVRFRAHSQGPARRGEEACYHSHKTGGLPESACEEDAENGSDHVS